MQKRKLRLREIKITGLDTANDERYLKAEMSESKLEHIPYPTARWVLETSLNSVGTPYFKNNFKQFKAFRNNLTLGSPVVS